jgi:CRP/FNR family transcriptional regulator, dissimilatory nitrate respiration regulator
MAVMTSRPSSRRTASTASTATMASLREIPYLADVPDEDLAALADLCSRRQVRAGGSLFTEGAAPTGLFLLLSGRARIVRTSRGGREQVLHEEGPGATLGEVPVFDGEGYVGSAIAVEDCTALFVPRQPLLAVIERNPAAARRVIHVLSRRVRRFALLVADLSLRDTTARVAAHVLREAMRANSDLVPLPQTREQLAAHLGTVREEVSRALSTLRDRGVLDVERRAIRVRDMRRLREIADA